MDTRRLALYLSRTRVGLGIAMMLAPRATMWPWLGATTGGAVPGVLIRTLGARDFVLGAGAAIAVGEQRGAANWISMSALVDGADAVASLVTPGLPARARIVGALAASSAVVHLALARELAREEAATP